MTIKTSLPGHVTGRLNAIKRYPCPPSAVADLLGCGTAIIPVWCRKYGLRMERTPGGMRRYPEETVRRLLEIQVAGGSE